MGIVPEAANFRSAAGLRRITAFALDYLLITAYLVLLAVVGSLSSTSPWLHGFAAVWNSPASAQGAAFVVLTLPVLLYFAITEASSRQGTLGKRAVGLAVTDEGGRRLSPIRSLIRSAIKLLPWQLAHSTIYLVVFAGRSAGIDPLVIGGFAVVYLLAGAYLLGLFIGTRRTIYDRIAGTSVVDR